MFLSAFMYMYAYVCLHLHVFFCMPTIITCVFVRRHVCLCVCIRVYNYLCMSINMYVCVLCLWRRTASKIAIVFYSGYATTSIGCLFLCACLEQYIYKLTCTCICIFLHT